jgi:hypothetical protein
MLVVSLRPGHSYKEVVLFLGQFNTQSQSLVLYFFYLELPV